jgi:nitrate reductase beta subunit
MTEEDMYDMYRLLALAKYDERYVIPPAHAEQAHSLEELATECSLDYEGGPGMGGSGPFGEGSGAPTPIAVENFQMLRNRQTSDSMASPDDKGARVNLLNWDGKGTPQGMFPDRPGEQSRPVEPVETTEPVETPDEGSSVVEPVETPDEGSSVVEPVETPDEDKP